MENKKDIIFKVENVLVDEIKEFENVLKELYDMENFILTLSFENSYKDIIRIDLSNPIGRTYGNNGKITLYHKVYYYDEMLEFEENDLIIAFFNIQKELKDLKIEYQISDNRK